MESTLIGEELMIRYFSGNINEEDRRMILSWINESHENERTLFLLKDIYDAVGAAQFYEEAKTAEGWDKLQKAIAQKKKTQKTAPTSRVIRPHWTENFRKYAAILVIGVVTGILLAHLTVSQNATPSVAIAGKTEIKTEKGERVTVSLPDGSTVKLNACSSLSYTADYGMEARHIQFTGEGYFDVQTNPDMPFVVQTSGLNIKAYGTAFNIKAYEEEDAVETTLVKGMVTIENEFHQKIVSLQPNQVITIPKKLIASKTIDESSLEKKETIAPEIVEPMQKISTQKAVLMDKIEPAIYTSWKDNRWIFKSENLESLAKKMERKYDVTFSFMDEASKKHVFSGTLKDYPLEQILEVIRLNAPIQYTVKEKTVVICEDKQLKYRFKQLISSP